MHTLEHLQMLCKDHTPPGLRVCLSSLPRSTILQLHRTRFESFDTRARIAKNSEIENRTGVVHMRLTGGHKQKRDDSHVAVVPADIQCEIVGETSHFERPKAFHFPFYSAVCVSESTDVY